MPSVQLLSIQKVIADASHRDLLNPVVPRSHQLQTLNQQVRCYFYLALLTDRYVHLLRVYLTLTLHTYINCQFTFKKLLR